MLVSEAVVSWVSCAQNDSIVVGDISARSVMRTADFPFGTTGKNTADVKKPMSESRVASSFAFSASPQLIKRMAVWVPCCSVYINLSNS